MSTNLPLQRLAKPVSAFPALTHSVRPRVLLPLQQRQQQQQQQTQRRTIFGFWNRKRDTTVLDPMSERFTQRKQKQDGLGSAVPERGSTGTGSILDATDTVEEAAEAKSSRREQKGDVSGGSGGSGAGVSLSERDPKLMAPALDPNPKARRAWERKMLIRELRRRGRIGKKTLLARTEREYLSKSPLIKTSIKKLMLLARQISGKPLDEAMVQMRFSKKKAAADILRHLERARDEAIVSRGMGLGAANAAAQAAEDGVPAPQPQPTRMVVQDKKGVRRAVMDKTAMYIDQAWVGRGTPDYGVDYRARGRAYRLVKPWTSITVVLKEEQTRIRQMNEREDKAAAKMPWLHLPDRPVTRQHQYPLW